MAAPEVRECEAASFRDPAARVCRLGGWILRHLTAAAQRDLESLSSKKFSRTLVESCVLVETEPVNEGQFSPLPDPWVAVLQHQTIDRLLSVRLVLQHAPECGVLQSRYEDTERNVRNDLRSVGFSAKLVKRNITRMRHFVERLTWTRGRSTWSDYTDYSTYDDSNRGRKKQFVLDAVRTRLRACIWDLGCNTGEYWRLVSSDADQVASVDPGFGWRHAGRQTLDDRGRPDLVPALALVHQLALSGNLPLRDLTVWFASFNATSSSSSLLPRTPW